MGVASDGILAYGYNLGGDDAGWEIHEAGDYGDWTPPWPDTEPPADLTEDDEEYRDEHRDLREDAAPLLTDTGTELISYCSDECPKWIVSAHTITVARGHIAQIDFTALNVARFTGDWDTKLAAALSALAITPRQEAPAWLLVSDWSGY